MLAPLEIPWATLSVLVAEDDLVSRMMLGAMLKECRLEATFARNGQEAVDLVAVNPRFDLILMDLRMPVMSGYQASQQIRAMGYRGPIIAQTAFLGEEERALALGHGFTAFLAKPIRMSPLLAAIRGALAV